MIRTAPQPAASTLGFAWAPLAITAASSTLSALLGRKSGQQKIAATTAANQIEEILRANLEEYSSGPRTAADQAVALDTFDAAWAWLVSGEGCGNPELGSAGQRCIDERRRGGSAPWCPTGTGCDWFTLYRDPIARDTSPTSGAVSAARGTADVFEEAGAISSAPFLLAAVLICLGVFL